MEEWKEYRLGDIIAIKSGFAYKGDMIGYGENVLLGMGCVSFKERFLMSGARAYAGDCADRYCANSGDIVLATRQQSDNLPILGMPAIIPNELREKRIIIGANLYRVDNESDFSNEYIYWLLKTPLYVNHIRSCQSGTTVRMITKANIEDFKFKAPNRKERDCISFFLKSIDDKIEVNRRINDNLEQQAQALFKSWFVDFEPFRDQPFVESELGMIPKGWRVYCLSDFLPVITGKKDANVAKGGPYPFFSCSQDFGWTDNYSFEGCAILIAGNGDFNVKMYSGKFEAYQRTYVLIPYNPNYTAWLYYAVKYHLNNITSAARGSVIKFITKGNLADFMFPAPSNLEKVKIIEAFDCIRKNISSIEKESRRLAKLRDTLLPRLMSGELKVNEIENAI